MSILKALESSRTLWTSRMLSIFRIVAGLILVLAGSAEGFRTIAGPLELVGGAAITLGLFTRPVALVLALEMAVASFRNSFEMATVLYSFLFLYLSLAGAGAWSIDALLMRRRIKRLQRPPRELDLGPEPAPPPNPRPVVGRTQNRRPVLHKI